MSVEEQPSRLSAPHEILKWSVSRPEWQRDALRRIVTNGNITDVDVVELDALCRAKHNANQIDPLVAKGQPLSDSHLPPSEQESSVSLVSIGSLRGVNRLPSNQTIRFGSAPGLTIVYGDNGSGKSGYARVLKKACRSRGVPARISPDAFAVSTAPEATGTIVFNVGANECTTIWKDNASCDPRLANVFVFDASTADHYLDEDGPATFTPSGLDILPKLAKVCDAVAERIRRDRDSIRETIRLKEANWKYKPATAVGLAVSKLSADADPTDIEALSAFDDNQARRYGELTVALKSDPILRAGETRAAVARLREFVGQVELACTRLSSTQALLLKQLIDTAKTTAETAKAHADGQFDYDALLGTGSKQWRELWEAARSFSTSIAYKDKEFPVTAEEAKCLLCQQPFSEEAAQRLRSFEAFCRDQSQRNAEDATRLLKEAAEKLQPMTPLALGFTKVQADLMPLRPEQIATVTDFIESADGRLARMTESLRLGTWEEPPQLKASPSDTIAALIETLEIRAQTEQSAGDPELRKTLEAECDELAGREWLASVLTDVLAQISRYKEIAVLTACLNDVSTSTITAANEGLTRVLVTGTFSKRFRDETAALGLRTLVVKLEKTAGRKGETKFGLRLDTKLPKPVHEIASEGERRCVALAAFLAELSLASHQSALVFDDPVSSLDHWHRERIALRLVRESLQRQVVVFTHDAVFLNDLQTNAVETNVPIEVGHLEWSGDTPGQYIQGLPWDWKSADDRFDKLEKEQVRIAAAWSPVPNEDNVESMRRAYSWLRATLERMVEKEVFADVVFRFRSYIDIKKLKKVVGFTNSECDELQRLVQRCHKVTEAHDSPRNRRAVPDPVDLARDIADAKNLLNQIRARQRSTTP